MFLLGLVAVALVGWWFVEKRRRKTQPVPPGYQADVSVAHEQEFELYHNALSLCSMKARVCMAELGIPYKSHPIDLIETGCYENIRPRLLGVNPAGTVPVLIHQGHPIYESHEQIRYAAQHAPAGSPSLVPEDADLRSEMERWIDLSSLTDDPLEHGEVSAGNAVPGQTIPLFATMIEKIPVWRILEGVLFHFDKKRPFMFLAFKLLGVGRLPQLAPAASILVRSRKQMNSHLDALEAKLVQTGGPWILGEAYSLADVSWMAIFERLRQADAEEVFLAVGRHPSCGAYWSRLKARASYREAITQQDHPLIEYGTCRIREAKAGDPELRELLEGDVSSAASVLPRARDWPASQGNESGEEADR